MLKEENAHRKTTTESNYIPGQRKGHTYRDYGGRLGFGELNNSRRLHLNRPPTGAHLYSHQQTKLDEIWIFLSNLRWEIGDEGSDIGTSWLELAILYEMRGHSFEHTKEGAADRLEQSLQNTTPHTKRWQKHLLQQGKSLKKKPTLACQSPTAISVLDEFKILTRYCIKNSGDVLTQTVFREAQDYEQRRFGKIVTTGHTPCIRAKPVISDDLAKQITRAILQCRPGMKTKTLDATVNFDNNNGPPPNLMETALYLKRSPPWRNGMHWPPFAAKQPSITVPTPDRPPDLQHKPQGDENEDNDDLPDRKKPKRHKDQLPSEANLEPGYPDNTDKLDATRIRKEKRPHGDDSTVAEAPLSTSPSTLNQLGGDKIRKIASQQADAIDCSTVDEASRGPTTLSSNTDCNEFPQAEISHAIEQTRGKRQYMVDAAVTNASCEDGKFPSPSVNSDMPASKKHRWPPLPLNNPDERRELTTRHSDDAIHYGTDEVQSLQGTDNVHDGENCLAVPNHSITSTTTTPTQTTVSAAHTDSGVRDRTDPGQVVHKVPATGDLGGQCGDWSFEKTQQDAVAGQVDLKAPDTGGLGDQHTGQGLFECRNTPWQQQQDLGPAGTETPSAVATGRGSVRVRQMEEEEETLEHEGHHPTSSGHVTGDTLLEAGFGLPVSFPSINSETGLLDFGGGSCEDVGGGLVSPTPIKIAKTQSDPKDRPINTPPTTVRGTE